MTVTPHETATRPPVTLCSACGSPSREYTPGCSTCNARRRQHRRRDRLRAERAKHQMGRLYVVSAGGDAVRLVWRTEDRCTSSLVSAMVDRMQRRRGCPELSVLREIACTLDQGHTVIESARKVHRDDHEWHDLDSVRERLDELEPEPERVVFVDDGERLTCTWGGRDFVLELRPGGRWRLSEVSSGQFARSTPGLVRTVNQARAWARVTVGRGWPK